MLTEGRGPTHFLQHLEHRMSTLPSTSCDHRVDATPLPTTLLQTNCSPVCSLQGSPRRAPHSCLLLCTCAPGTQVPSIVCLPGPPAPLLPNCQILSCPGTFARLRPSPGHRREVWLGHSVSMQNLGQWGLGAGSRRSPTRGSFLRWGRGAHSSRLTREAAGRGPRSLRRRCGDLAAARTHSQWLCFAMR